MIARRIFDNNVFDVDFTIAATAYIESDHDIQLHKLIKAVSGKRVQKLHL
jgi:hypothetical protein